MTIFGKFNKPQQAAMAEELELLFSMAGPRKVPFKVRKGMFAAILIKLVLLIFFGILIGPKFLLSVEEHNAKEVLFITLLVTVLGGMFFTAAYLLLFRPSKRNSDIFCHGELVKAELSGLELSNIEVNHEAYYYVIVKRSDAYGDEFKSKFLIPPRKLIHFKKIFDSDDKSIYAVVYDKYPKHCILPLYYIVSA